MKKGSTTTAPSSSSRSSSANGAKLPLHDAACDDNDEALRRHFANPKAVAKTPIDGRDSEGKTALMVAAMYCERLATLEILLKHGASVNAQDQRQETALWKCISNEQNDVVAKLLVVKGADVNLRAEDGSSPLMRASFLGKVELARFLLRYGANPRHQERVSGKTALSLALAGRCPKRATAVAELLLARGGDVQRLDRTGFTALHQAATAGLSAVVSLLLTYPPVVASVADKAAFLRRQTRDEARLTALHQAAQRGHKAVAALLLHHGADVDARAGGESSATPLILAAARGHATMVQLLLAGGLAGAAGARAAAPLARGATIDLVDGLGMTALMHAVNEGKLEVARLLIDQGASLGPVVAGPWRAGDNAAVPCSPGVKSSSSSISSGAI